VNRKQIGRNVGNVVAYIDRGTNQVVPAMVLDSRLWEVFYEPGPRVKLSERTRADLFFTHYKVGYPVLMPPPGNRRSLEQLEVLKRRLADTVLTMEDLFDKEGADKGILNEGLIFRVVSPAGIRENYEGVAEQWLAAQALQDRQLQQLRDEQNAARAAAVRLNNTLAGFGFASPDELPIVWYQHVDRQRLTIATGVLEELVMVASQLLKGCDNCGERDYLLPHEQPHVSLRFLCAGCHPRVQ
jgi:hypothetical protein